MRGSEKSVLGKRVSLSSISMSSMHAMALAVASQLSLTTRRRNELTV